MKLRSEVGVMALGLILLTGCKKSEISDEEILVSPLPIASITTTKGDTIPSLKLHQAQETSFMDSEVKSLRAIPLETTDSCLIGSITYLRVIGDTIVVVDGQKAKRIFLFNTDGTFLNSIGRAGSGPGEYSVVSQAIADNSGISIYDMQTNRYIRYDYQGNVIGETSFNETSPVSVMRQSDEIFIGSYASYFKNFPFAIQWLDGDSIEATAFPYAIKRHETAPSLFRFNEMEIGLHIPTNDTVYTMSGHQILPKFTLGLITEKEAEEYQRKSAKMDIREENEYLFKDKNAPACFVDIFPLQDYFIVTHQKGVKTYISIVNRKTLHSRSYLRGSMSPIQLYLPPYQYPSSGNRLAGYFADDYFLQIPEKSREFIEKHFSEQDRQIIKNHDYANSNPIVWLMEIK